MIGGMIFIGWKMIKSAFSIVFKSDKDKKTGIYDTSNIAWLLGPAALLGISQGVSGE